MIKIALTCSAEDRRYFLKSRYIDYLMRGADSLGIRVYPMILPHTESKIHTSAYAREFDGFIFTGGGDIDPILYGKRNTGLSNDIDLLRDRFELALLDEIMKNNKSVLGICRGIQIMAVACGGSIRQDLSDEFSGEEHTDSSGRHTVDLCGIGENIFGCRKITTNSYHHQSVINTGNESDICGTSYDGTVEMISSAVTKFFIGVQWHPEINPDDNSMKLIRAYLTSTL